ncbi:MAG: hypothetical protein PHF29_05545 [Candidatus Riflebacteria bacterium]|nr:hypothetical protein [Candidatus Riflebacteria bacterium]
MKEFIVVALIIFLILFVKIILNPSSSDQFWKKPDSKAIARACTSNMRIMTGVVEMYNLEHKDSLKLPEYGMFQKDGVLFKLGYLRPLFLNRQKSVFIILQEILV